jgi:hypothetical protein
MIITLRLFGTLIPYFGSSRVEIVCPPSTTFADICEIINARWGRKLPSQLWDKEEKYFVGGVLVMIDEKDVGQQRTLMLSEGQEIFILIPICGGKPLIHFGVGCSVDIVRHGMRTHSKVYKKEVKLHS